MKALEVFSPLLATPLPLPLFLGRVPAGFPSPADDFLEERLDLNKHLIKNQAATFFVRASGDSMIGAGIHNGDILVVDRSITPADRCVIVAVLSGEFTVKRLRKKGPRAFLYAENPNYKPVSIEDGMDFQVWGVVTNVIHKLQG
jgi:DNA polymerase V